MIYKLERKLGKYAIPDLTKYIIGLYCVDYLLYYVLAAMGTNSYALFGFVPEYILSGQIWRIVSWILIPPSSLSFWTFIMLLMFYQFGMILQHTWGDFKYNFFIFNGLIVTLVTAFIGYFICRAMGMGTSILFPMNTYYVSLSTFLAVAACYPDMEVRLYFLIPIKFKWAAAIDIVYMIYEVVQGMKYGLAYQVVMIVASLINLAIMLYLLKTGSFSAKDRFKQAKRRTEFNQQYRAGASSGYKSASGQITKHKCAICGRTELDGDDLEFRFCSKCHGNYEYCQDHLFTHTHK